MTLLAERERLLDERKDDGKERSKQDYELNFVLKTRNRMGIRNNLQAQKAMDYIIEEDN